MAFSGNNAQNLTSKVRVKLEGDWQNFNALMKYLGGGAFSRGIKRDLAKGQRDFAVRYKTRLALALATGGKSNNRPFKAHTGSYAAKSRTGIVGMRSGNYLRALKNLRIKQKGYQITIGYSKGDLLTKSFPGGYRLGKYAVLFEAGGVNQKARPLWNDTYRAMGGNRGLLKAMKNPVARRLRTYKVHISI